MIPRGCFQHASLPAPIAAAESDPMTHPSGNGAFLNSDVYRLAVSIEGAGWTAGLLNGLAAAGFPHCT